MEPIAITTGSCRQLLPRSEEIWNHIDQAVHAECIRTKIASKFLPMVSRAMETAVNHKLYIEY
jgi:hypothetical protein